ncbi:MAG: hypothetical protein R2847_11150 [Bacteroidia bacterium]
MLLKRFFSFALVMATATILCAAQMPDSVITGAEQLNVYLPKLRNQKVACGCQPDQYCRKRTFN